MTITTFAEAEKVLAQRLPGYTERPQQQALAAFVEQIIATGGHGLAEAGCGTGKSLATMIPAILGGKKTVVATATKALMEQYANKDVPFLEEHLGVPFTWALLKGRSNYVCMAKVAETNTDETRSLAQVMAEIDADEDHSGDFDHFSFTVPEMDKSRLSSTANDCPGKKKCPFADQCFAEKAKARAAESQVVITNTAMLMTDLKVRELTDGYATMLGNYDLVLIDEAHETEDYATSSLQSEIRNTGVIKTVTEARNFARMNQAELTKDVEVLNRLDVCWNAMDEGRKNLAFFVEHDEEFMALFEALQDFADEISDITIIKDGDGAVAQQNRLVRRLGNYATTLSLAITTDDRLLVRWIEIDNTRREPVKIMRTAPVHVGSYLAAWLWEQTSAVLLSATLSVHGDFGYISDRLGLPSTTEALSVGTPFDYQTQAMVFAPPANVSSPKDRNGWLGYYNTATTEMVKMAGGGALLLFTSRSAMQAAYENLSDTFEAQGYTCLMQGQDTNKVLARRFAEDTNSVLFALKSFMTGVDFQGDTCRLVVIDKLPFPVPTEPVFEARADLIKSEGRSDFRELTIPIMTLTLEQAFGRLIRTSADRGVVAIMDSRLTSTGYGKQILRGLPDCPRTTDLLKVAEFYKA